MAAAPAAVQMLASSSSNSNSNMVLLALTVMIGLVSAHSFLATPNARDSNLCAALNSGSWCPPCGWDGRKESARPSAATYGRGDVVPLQWPRNNHPSGFISLALVPFDSAQTYDDFENNIIHYNCFEAGGCASYNPVGDSLGGDPNEYGDDEYMCTSTWTVPDWVADGQYTFQWKWFGGGAYQGDEFRGVSDWYSCHDFTVSGGNYADPEAKPACPVFLPGDASNDPSQGVCRYFKAPEPLACFPEGCSGQYDTGVPSALQQCWDQNGGTPDSFAQSLNASPAQFKAAAAKAAAPAAAKVAAPVVSKTTTASKTATAAKVTIATPRPSPDPVANTYQRSSKANGLLRGHRGHSHGSH
ncbi:hypothetical protein BC828DRAFT_375393 [Blastocladiella britannica]|nr:hypothetical protein BC828DRAFT_375393 [Blastocladiella britannica]